MGSKKSFNIAVGKPESLQSSIWRFWVEKNEIYVMTREERNVSKLSLHSSGISRFAYLAEKDINDPLISDSDPRVIARWKQIKDIDTDWWRRLDILIYGVPIKRYFSLNEALKPKGPITWLDPLPIGYKYQITLLVAKSEMQNPQEILLEDDAIIGKFFLKNENVVWLRVRKEKIPEVEQKELKNKLMDLRINYEKVPDYVFVAMKEIDQESSHPLIVNYALGWDKVFTKGSSIA